MKRLSLLMASAALLLGASQVEAQILYGATSAGGPGQLVTLNPANGSLLTTIGPTNDAGAFNYPITGLAVHPVTGVIYGSTGNSVAGAEARLVTINPATALVTVIGSYNAGPVNGSGIPATMADIAFDSAGNLFGVGSIGGPQVYSINLATGQATVIGSTGLTSTTGGGLAISPAGTFFGTPTASRFGTYNSVTGAYTNIGPPSSFPAGQGSYSALAFNGSVLFGLNTGPGANPPTHIVTFDQATGTVTDVGVSVNSLDAIAFAPTPVPEPSTLLLLAGPAAMAWIAKKRRRNAESNETVVNG